MLILSGSDSMLAQSLLPVLREKNQVFAFDSKQGETDNADFLSGLINKTGARIFINCAEMNNSEECAYKKEEAYAVNSFAPRSISKVCAELKIKLIHISSSFVYGGKENKIYSETDPVCPINVFGDSKLLGENYILESCCESLILRLPQIYGRGNSFITDVLRESGPANLISNQIISTVYSNDAAALIAKAVDSGLTGIYNLSNSGFCEISHFFKTVLERYEVILRKSLPKTISATDYRDFISAAEPVMYGALDISRFQKDCGITIRTWNEALEDYMKNFGMYI